MANEPDCFTAEHWASLLDSIDQEIARQALICRVPLFERGVIARVLARDALVCSADHPTAFRTLRALLVLHYMTARHLAPQAAVSDEAVAAQIQARLNGHPSSHPSHPPPTAPPIRAKTRSRATKPCAGTSRPLPPVATCGA